MSKSIMPFGQQTHTILQPLVKAHESIHHSLNLCIGQLSQSHTVLQSKEQKSGVQPHTCIVACPQRTIITGSTANRCVRKLLQCCANAHGKHESSIGKLVCHLQVMLILWFRRTDTSKRGCLNNWVRMRPTVNKPGRPVVGVQL